jgi:hypothetical protein
MPNPNRNKGHRWELTVLAMLKPIFPNVLTSRNESRTEDAKKIDLVNTGDLAVQCKNYATTPNFVKIFEEMDCEDRSKVIFYKNNKYRGDKGELVVMQAKDFVDLIKALEYSQQVEKALGEELGKVATDYANLWHKDKTITF